MFAGPSTPLGRDGFMKVSVIIPCYNNEPYLGRCLAALFAQTYPRDEYEVIFVDNNSTDRSVEIAKGFPDLMILGEKAQSSYAARNRGVMQASGEILIFTDSDCEVCPTWIEDMVSSLAMPGIALALGGRRNATESFTLALVADYDAQKAAFVCAQEDRRLYYGYTNNMAVRREAFLRCGPFMQIARGADTVFVSRVLETYGTDSVQYVQKAVVRHLEIKRIFDWYRKVATYGYSYEGYRVWSHSRTIGFRGRIVILRQTIARNGYVWPRALALAALLAIGIIPFEMGRLKRLQRRSAGRR